MINAEIVAHSLSPQGDELISVLATFPRHILAEVNTHRMLSKNTSSSRAIPFLKMVEAVETNPFIPIAWQKNHSGMQGSEYHEDVEQGIRFATHTWLRAKDNAIKEARMLNQNCDVTKQLANRLLEPFMWTTMLITGSREGWENFFRLRCPQYRPVANTTETFRSKKDAIERFPPAAELTNMNWFMNNQGAAEIHIMDLAEKIWDARNESTPKQLQPGEWHIPFGSKMVLPDSMKKLEGNMDEVIKTLLHTQVKASVAMAARTSYTMVGEEKALDYEALVALHDRLLTQDPPHSSPFEHTARAMSDEEWNSHIKGISEYDDFDIRQGGYSLAEIFPERDRGWCYNLKGFIPYRYIVDNSLSL